MITKITIKGNKVQNVGYRPLLFAKALRLKIPNFDARNEEKENGKQSVIILISGKCQQITDFVTFVQSKSGKPKNADVDSIEVEDIISTEDIDIISIGEYEKILNVEQTNNIVQGGQKIDNKLDTGFGMLGEKIDSLRTETNDNFKNMDDNFSRMDIKYHIISERMFALVDAIEKRQQSFEMHIEKIDKNIETLLEILVKNK